MKYLKKTYPKQREVLIIYPEKGTYNLDSIFYIPHMHLNVKHIAGKYVGKTIHVKCFESVAHIQITLVLDINPTFFGPKKTRRV